MPAGPSAQHPRGKPDAVERLAIPSRGDLIAGPARQVRPGVGIETLRGEALVVGKVDDSGGYLGRLADGIGHGAPRSGWLMLPRSFNAAARSAPIVPASMVKSC